MDYPVTDTEPDGEAPVVVMAGRFQFGPSEELTNRSVASRALIWGCAGAGTICTSGRNVELRPGDWVFLPWQHDITYRADPHDPFMVGGVHLIPWHDPARPVEPYAAHGRRDRLAGVPYRRDAEWPELRGLIVGGRTHGDRLLALASLAVDHMHEGRPEDATLRALARLLLNEMRTAIVAGVTRERLPLTLGRMQEFVAAHLRQPLSVRRIARSAGVSESTAERLFRRHTGRSVGVWVAERRMARARELLRTTDLPVGSIAREIGIPDQSYFSRAFRRMNGVSPRAYADRTRLL